MARLNDADLRVMLGDNYTEVQAKFEAEHRTAVSPAEKRAKLDRDIKMNGELRFTAMAMVLTGAFMTWAGWKQANYHVDIASGVGIALFVVAVIWYGWLVSKGRNFAKRSASVEGY